MINKQTDKRKKRTKSNIVSSPRNHLSTILPTIPLYDFPSLSPDMRMMLYDRITRVVGYYTQHRKKSIDRHLLSPSSLELLHRVSPRVHQSCQKTIHRLQRTTKVD